jgi:two-component system, NarL family, nitrate/nitrite response regulator NarL
MIGMNRILLVGTQLSREGLKGLLVGTDFAPVGEARTLVEAHRLLCAAPAEDQPAQIMLMYSEGRLGGDNAAMLSAIHRDQPAVKVIVLGDPATLGLLAQACPTEIAGYLLNDTSVPGLMHALDLIMSGQRVLPPSSHPATLGARPTQEAPVGPKPTTGLSAREAQILQLLVVGSSNKAIGRDLAISHETVKVHMKALLRKLNARNRTQAAVWGLANGNKQVGSPNMRVFAAFAVGILIPALETLSLGIESGLSVVL